MRGPIRQPALRAALTLVELLVVLTLVALVTGTVALRYGATTRPAKLEWAVDTIASTDDFLRRVTMSRRPGSLRIDLTQNRLQVFVGQDLLKSVAVGTTARMSQVRTAGRRNSSGLVTIDYLPGGRGATFAVELSLGEERHWLVFAGLTGQLTRFTDERDVEKILDALAETRNHPR